MIECARSSCLAAVLKPAIAAQRPLAGWGLAAFTAGSARMEESCVADLAETVTISGCHWVAAGPKANCE
jgi:hypothetical protein